MAVPEQIPYVGYIANGVTNEFAINFDLHDPQFLIVTLNKEIPILGAYTVDIVNQKVIFGVAPTSGDQVEFYRDTTLDRDTEYKSYDNSFRPEALNWDLDKIWMTLQEQNFIDSKILARLKSEIEWRRTHDFNYDELAQVREKQLFDALKGYTDTLNAATNPGIFQGVIAGVVFAIDGKSIQTHIEETVLALTEIRAEIQNLESGTAQAVGAEVERATAAEQQEIAERQAADLVLQNQINANGVGNKAYKTYAEMDADKANIAAKSKVTVTNDATSSNNGDWQWDGAVFTKSLSDLLTQAKADATTKANAVKVYAEDLVLDISNARNLIVDSFFKDADNSGMWLGRLRSSGLTFITNEKFDFGKTAVKADNTTFNLELYIDELQPAASFEVAMLMSVTAAKNIYINADYYSEAGRVQANVSINANKALTAGDNTVKFTLTPPAYTSRIRFTVGHLSGATGLKLHAMWAANVNVPDLPIVPYSKLSKAVTPTTFDKYSAASITTVIDVKDPVISAGSNSIFGFGCDLTPSADFNALQFDGLLFDENAKYLVVNIYSSPDIGSNPLNDAAASHVSKTIVELDSKAKRVKNLLVPTCDPKTSAIKTVTTAMLGARYCITYETQDKIGTLVARLSPVCGTMTNLIGSQGRYRTSSAWVTGYVYPIAIRHINATNIELKRALNVKDGLDEFNEPALIVPKKIYGFVGAESSLYFDNITQDKNVDFTMLFPANFVGLRQFERWMYKPVAAGETSFTISSSKAGFELDIQTVAVKVVADNAVTATKSVHFIGDSLIEYGDKLKALYDLQAANAYTKLKFVGTRALAAPYADVKHNGYAGKSIDQLFTAVIPSVGTNPFYNPTTNAFDYSYFLSNNSIDTPDFVFVGFGPNDMSSIITDGMAIAKAKFICDYYQRMIDSIKTASVAIKVVIAASVPSGDDANGFTTAIARGEQWRMNRNLKILAKEVYSRFGSSESSGIYVSHASCSFDTKTGYRALGRAPKNASIKFDTYTTYAAMIADLSKTDRTIAYVTDVADYFVKVGGVGIGTWVYATERDGIVRRLTDSVHYNAVGGYQHALVDYALIKCVS